MYPIHCPSPQTYSYSSKANKNGGKRDSHIESYTTAFANMHTRHESLRVLCAYLAGKATPKKVINTSFALKTMDFMLAHFFDHRKISRVLCCVHIFHASFVLLSVGGNIFCVRVERLRCTYIKDVCPFSFEYINNE